jgi:hypothetical protein
MRSWAFKYGTLVLLAFTARLSAQVSSFFVNSQYGGTYASRINPATTVQMKHKWVLSLGDFDGKIFNNYLSASMPYHPYRLALGNYPDSLRTPYNNPVWRWSWLKTNAGEQHVNLHAFVRISGPSFFTKFKQHGFGIFTEMNFFADLKGVPKPLVDEFYEDLKRGHKTTEPNINFLNNPQKIHLNIKQQSWMTLGLSYSYLWKFKRRKMLSAGITYKFLHGNGGSQIQVDADNMEEQDDHKIKISSPGFQVKSLLPRNNVFFPKGYGGVDLGVQLFNKKNETGRLNNSSKIHPDYLFRIGASILDIGNLVYSRSIVTELKSATEEIEMPSIEEILSWTPEKVKENLMESIQKFEGIEPETFYGRKTKVGLPTRLMLHGDIQMNKFFYLDFVLQQNLRKRGGDNINTFSYLMLSPRIERRNYTLGLPLSLENNYRNPTLGFYARYFFIYFGSRNIVSFIHPNGKKAVDFFLGVQLGNIPGALFKMKTPYLFMKKRRCAEF